MTINLGITVSALEQENEAKNANCDFEGTISITDANKKNVTISYLAKKQKGFISDLSLSENQELGTIPVSLHNEIYRLIAESINDFQNNNTKTKPPIKGLAVNNFFHIQNNQWVKFIDPKRHEEKAPSIPPQRNSILEKNNQ